MSAGTAVKPVLILASASPRRKMLMQRAGLICTVMPCDVDETPEPGKSPDELVRIFALRKARYARELTRSVKTGIPQKNTPLVIIAADTLVAVDGRVLGKPKDEADAFDMLTLLQGRSHTVFTGLSLIMAENGNDNDEDKDNSGGTETGNSAGTWAGFSAADGDEKCQTLTDSAKVFMRPLTDNEIRAYIRTGEPLDKAGAYGIQEMGAMLIERVEGDYHTVVGLPLARLWTMLAAWGVDVTRFWTA